MEPTMPTPEESAARTLIEAQWIAPVRANVPGDAADEYLVDHAVVIESDRILDVLPTAHARQRYPDAVRVPLPGHLLVPGVVTRPTHAATPPVRGGGAHHPT